MTGLGVLVSLGLALGGTAMTAKAESYTELAGRYVLAEIGGAPAGARVVLEIPAQGAWRGEGPCNRFGFAQGAAFPAFHAGAIRGTKRACPDLATENAVLGALQGMTGAKYDGAGLRLTDGDGQSLLFLPLAD